MSGAPDPNVFDKKTSLFSTTLATFGMFAIAMNDVRMKWQGGESV